ncbi:MAG: sugar phosphate isomerase/epimerase family protein [Sphingomonadales bacterium]
MKTRRSFLKTAGALAAGASLYPQWVDAAKGNPRPFGIQLYTLRNELPGKARELLQQVAKQGYSYIESYEGPEGIYWNHSPKAFKEYLDNLGLKMVSTHCDVSKNFERKAADAASIGVKYLICPWVGPQRSIDAFKKIAQQFNEMGAICKKNGIRFAYHNHDYSFKSVEEQIPQAVLLKETDPTLVDFELDIYWANYAGQDPLQWIANHPNRFKLCHVKDKSRAPYPKEGYLSVDLGTGSIDFKKILPKAVDLGMEYLIVEQEFYPNGSQIEAAATGAAYMKRLRF